MTRTNLTGQYGPGRDAVKPTKPWPYAAALRVDIWLAHVLLHLIGPNATLLDVGASHGAYGVFFHNCNANFRLHQYTGIDGLPNVEAWTSPPFAPPGAFVRSAARVHTDQNVAPPTGVVVAPRLTEVG